MAFAWGSVGLFASFPPLFVAVLSSASLVMEDRERPTSEALGGRRFTRHRLRGRGVLFSRGRGNPSPSAPTRELALALVVSPSAVVGAELEKLRRSLDASQAAFGAADREVHAIRDLLATAVGRVAELEAEILGIRNAAGAAAESVHARSGSHVERLLDIPDLVRDAVVFGIHRGAAAALTVAQACSDHMLYHLVGIPEGLCLSDFAGFLEDFDEAADTVVDLIPAKDVVEEATSHLGP